MGSERDWTTGGFAHDAYKRSIEASTKGDKEAEIPEWDELTPAQQEAWEEAAEAAIAAAVTARG